MQKKIKMIADEVITVLAGSLLFAVGIDMFILPAGIVLGGMTGISTMLNIFFGTPVGLMIILLNIPLLIANTYFFGKAFLGRTIIGIAATSLMVDFLEMLNLFGTADRDPLLCAILGGAAVGVGTGFLMSRGYTTGGTDLIACLVKIKAKRVSMGTVVVVADIIIIVGAALVNKSFDGLLYSIICAWAMSKTLDVIISGSRRAGQAFIITNKPDEITARIFEHLDRGVTMMDAVGGFTGEPKRMLMCVVAKSEIFYLKKLIMECDPDAFVIIADASEVTGEGFKLRETAQ